VGVVGFVLSLGPGGVRPLYAALHDLVFGFQAIRAPARFSALVFFALAVLAGLGVDALVARRPAARALVLCGVCALLLVEFSTAIPFARSPALTSAVGQWLRDAPEPGPVVYLPIGRDTDDVRAMLSALEHGRPILNGFSGQRPGLYAAVVDQVSAFPDRTALLTLRELGVRFVVAMSSVRPAIAAGGGVSQPGAATPVVERAAFPEGTIYELRWTPEIDAAFDELDRVAPPPPGRIPFADGETTRYDVHWVGGPVQVPAAEAVITAARAADGYRLTVHAATAPWVRRFFEADDTLTTETDERLLPRVYREVLDEGSRHTRRTVVFEPDAKRVLVTNGDLPPVTLPLRRDARDPLSELFYARTLPLAAGYRAELPVSDAGRNTVVAIEVQATETIEVNGQPREVWRVAPTFISRLAWREPPRAVAWLTRDTRHLPLRIRVTAAFGTLELTAK
jgi:hypothetical protein